MGTNILRSPEANEVIAALSVYVDAGKELDRLIDLRNERIARAVYQSPNFKNPGGGNRGGLRPDKMADSMASIEKIDKRVFEILNNYQQLLEWVQACINTLYPNYNQILVMEWRYINGEKWDYISQRTGFSLVHCYKLHSQAITSLIKNGIIKKGAENEPINKFMEPDRRLQTGEN